MVGRVVKLHQGALEKEEYILAKEDNAHKKLFFSSSFPFSGNEKNICCKNGPLFQQKQKKNQKNKIPLHNAIENLQINTQTTKSGFGLPGQKTKNSSKIALNSPQSSGDRYLKTTTIDRNLNDQWQTITNGHTKTKRK